MATPMRELFMNEDRTVNRPLWNQMLAECKGATCSAEKANKKVCGLPVRLVAPDFVGCRYHQYACKQVFDWMNKYEREQADAQEKKEKKDAGEFNAKHREGLCALCNESLSLAGLTNTSLKCGHPAHFRCASKDEMKCNKC